MTGRTSQPQPIFQRLETASMFRRKNLQHTQCPRTEYLTLQLLIRHPWCKSA